MLKPEMPEPAFLSTSGCPSLMSFFVKGYEILFPARSVKLIRKSNSTASSVPSRYLATVQLRSSVFLTVTGLFIIVAVTFLTGSSAKRVMTILSPSSAMDWLLVLDEAAESFSRFGATVSFVTETVIEPASAPDIETPVIFISLFMPSVNLTMFTGSAAMSPDAITNEVSRRALTPDIEAASFVPVGTETIMSKFELTVVPSFLGSISVIPVTVGLTVISPVISNEAEAISESAIPDLSAIALTVELFETTNADE